MSLRIAAGAATALAVTYTVRAHPKLPHTLHNLFQGHVWQPIMPPTKPRIITPPYPHSDAPINKQQ